MPGTRSFIQSSKSLPSKELSQFTSHFCQSTSLLAPSGKIHLSAISGSFQVIPDSNHLSFEYPNNLKYGNIRLTDRSSLIASGFSGGDIFAQAKHVYVVDSSLLLVENLFEDSIGNITISATGNLSISGFGILQSPLTIFHLLIHSYDQSVVSQHKLFMEKRLMFFLNAYNIKLDNSASVSTGAFPAIAESGMDNTIETAQSGDIQLMR